MEKKIHFEKEKLDSNSINKHISATKQHVSIKKRIPNKSLY